MFHLWGIDFGICHAHMGPAMQALHRIGLLAESFTTAIATATGPGLTDSVRVGSQLML